MSKKLDLGIYITIATILISVGGSFALVRAKTDKVDSLEAQIVDDSKKVAILETKLDLISENIKDQKQDLKDILKALEKKNVR